VKILELEDDVFINEILVNEENKHVYGISNNSHKLYHFDKEFKIKQIIDISPSLLIKLLNNNLYMLMKGYDKSNFEASNRSQLIENKPSFIGIYSQKENEDMKYERKIVLNVLIAPCDFHVDKNYIFIFTPFINKNHLIKHKYDVLVFNHDGILLQKTGLELCFEKIPRFLVIDYETIYFADFESNTFVLMKFSSNPLKVNKFIAHEIIIDEYIKKKDELMKERNKKAFLNILFTILITILYYADIGTDLLLCRKYYINGDIFWFRTLGIVVFSSLLNTSVLFYYSYFQEFKINLKKKQLGRIIIKSFCLLFQFEMLFW
jgi:hypothetical protein